MERPKYVFRARGKALQLGDRTCIMGVINVTPDSFSDGGRYFSPDRALDRCFQLLEAGADILDIGGESSRPGARPVSATEELDRVAPVLDALRPRSSAILSIDTYKPAVAKECLRLGADVINDITALRDPVNVAPLAGSCDAGLVLMHMRGVPETMQTLPGSEDIVGEAVEGLRQAACRAREAGIQDDHILVDPGLGFGKTFEDNLRIINQLPVLAAELRLPILIGPSRKSFLGKITGRAADERTLGTAAAAVIAALRGAHIVRVHDVAEAREALAVADAVLAERLI